MSTYKIPHCEQEGCQGHLGKFDSCRDEALYELTMDEREHSTGDTDWHGYYTLVILGPDESVTEEWLADGHTVHLPAGNYIVVTWSTGAASVWTYDTEAEATTEWQRIDDEFNAGTDENGDLLP